VTPNDGSMGVRDSERGNAPQLSTFNKLLPVWVVLCMVLGTLIGSMWPEVPQALDAATVANVSLPVAVLIWIMVFPMTLSVDLRALQNVKQHPRGLLLTTALNWAVQPFLMYGLAVLFFEVSIHLSRVNKTTKGALRSYDT
jgi:ACR3 family arsenite transporter